MRYILVDFETTGLDPLSSEIIEIAAIEVVDGLEHSRTFQTLVRPSGRIPDVITHITGITQEMVSDAPGIREAARGFLEFVDGAPMIAHNAFMEQKFFDQHLLPLAEEFDLPVPPKVLDSIEPFALVLPELASHSLEAIRKWANLSSEGAHRAEKDCLDVLEALRLARTFLFHDRAQIAGIVTSNLAATGWWWLWYFEPATEEEAAALETSTQKRPADFGDLKKLRAADTDREIEWDSPIDEQEVHEAFEHGSARVGFEYRPAQERMGQVIRETLNEGARVAIEAPTGTGKSVAYLIPGLLSSEAAGVPLVVSTHSKALQDQLLEKDIPAVARLLDRESIRATAVKGQDNYLCLRKLHELNDQLRLRAARAAKRADALAEAAEDDLAFDGGTPEAPESVETYEQQWCAAYLLAFASVTPIVELDRVSRYLKGRFPFMWRLTEIVRSHHTTTVGPGCAYYKQCHFYNSARLAHQSDIIIANHALVFQWPQHLPKIRNVVFDEAHHLEDKITDAFSVRVSERDVTETLNRLTKKYGSGKVSDLTRIAAKLQDLNLPEKFSGVDPGRALDERCENLRSRLHQLHGVVPLCLPGLDAGGFETPIDFAKPRSRAHPDMLESVRNLHGAVRDLKEYFEAGWNAAQGGKGGHEFHDFEGDLLATYTVRLKGFEEALATALSPDEPNHLRLIYWDPRENSWRVEVSPIEVAQQGETFFQDKRAIVLTSATMSSGDSGEFITSRIGFKTERPMESLPSPFNLEHQARVYIPTDIPVPGTADHLNSIIDFTEAAARAIGGRTLLLITSNMRLRKAADALRKRLKDHGIAVFDSLTDHRAAENFRSTEKAVLIGSERYGEGLDIPGPALSCVIIEKINEAMTRGPLPEARKQRIRSGLFAYDFPLRLIWLKQRVGRLIRAPGDRGAVVVFDPRYHGWAPRSRAIVDAALAPIPVQTATCSGILRELPRVCPDASSAPATGATADSDAAQGRLI